MPGAQQAGHQGHQIPSGTPADESKPQRRLPHLPGYADAEPHRPGQVHHRRVHPIEMEPRLGHQRKRDGDLPQQLSGEKAAALAGQGDHRLPGEDSRGMLENSPEGNDGSLTRLLFKLLRSIIPR